ncbi:hypothetical protein Trydic_g15062 [Trypoxylus dichotomus]
METTEKMEVTVERKQINAENGETTTTNETVLDRQAAHPEVKFRNKKEFNSFRWLIISNSFSKSTKTKTSGCILPFTRLDFLEFEGGRLCHTLIRTSLALTVSIDLIWQSAAW